MQKMLRMLHLIQGEGEVKFLASVDAKRCPRVVYASSSFENFFLREMRDGYARAFGQKFEGGFYESCFTEGRKRAATYATRTHWHCCEVLSRPRAMALPKSVTRRSKSSVVFAPLQNDRGGARAV